MKNRTGMLAVMGFALSVSMFAMPARAQGATDQDDAKITAVTMMKTGNDLLWSCTEDSQSEGINVFSSAMCAMYIHGIADLLGERREACGVPAPTYEQMRDVVVKFLKDDPVDRSKPPAVLVEYALKTAFPCGGKPKKGAKR